MAKRTDFEQVFVELKKFVPSALKCCRLHRNRSVKNLVEKLRESDKWKQVTVKMISSIENGKREIRFDEFVDICLALDNTVARVLQNAVFLRDLDGKSKKKLAGELLQETEYLLWEAEQKEPGE